MKKASVSFLVLVVFLANTAMADCDFSKIKNNGDGTYTYTKELHICVGNLVQDNATKTAQISDLNKAITLKDLALQAADERTQLWIGSSDKLSDRVQKIDSLESKNDWLWFGLGVLATIGAGYAASRAYR